MYTELFKKEIIQFRKKEIGHNKIIQIVNNFSSLFLSTMEKCDSFTRSIQINADKRTNRNSMNN